MDKKRFSDKAPLWFKLAAPAISHAIAINSLVTNPLSFHYRNSARNTDKQAKILVGGSICERAGLFGMTNIPSILNDYFSLNRKTFPEWNFSATGDDLIDAVRDPEYSSIACIGHGNRELWEAKDRIVTYDEVTEAFGDRKRKKGVWLQYHCGNDSIDQIPMGYEIMERPDETCIFYTTSLSNLDMMWNGRPNINARKLVEGLEA